MLRLQSRRELSFIRTSRACVRVRRECVRADKILVWDASTVIIIVGRSDARMDHVPPCSLSSSLAATAEWLGRMGQSAARPKVKLTQGCTRTTGTLCQRDIGPYIPSKFAPISVPTMGG